MGPIPAPLSYRNLASQRADVLNQILKSERPSKGPEDSSLAYLNALRLTSPQTALPLAQEMLRRDPHNASLHNLLGLIYLELDELSSAKVTWLSMIARKVKHSAIQNNLGVVASLEGKEADAIGYFNEALKLDNSTAEAATNLGFLALKHRNGGEAKKYFEQALGQEGHNLTAKVGSAVAELQSSEVESVRGRLVALTQSNASDPYAFLSLGYYFIDVGEDYESARQLISGYLKNRESEEGNGLFQRILQETGRVSATQESASLAQ
jgi:Flp pilus assembly protein TadD